MKDAKTLLLEFLAAVARPRRRRPVRRGRDARTAVPAFGGHPLAPPGSAGDQRAPRLLAGLYADFTFKPEDTHVLIDTPEQVFAEYTAHPTVKTTGRTLHHVFAARLVAENGLIKLVRESLNVVAAAQALLPGGVKDLSDPEIEIFSLPPDYRS